jgi:hypothetical protein
MRLSPMQRMASVLHGNANMLECIDHLRRNYTLDPGVRLWAGETLRDVADDLNSGARFCAYGPTSSTRPSLVLD